MSKDKRIFRSVEEFEAEVFPKYFEERSRKEITDPIALGTKLANESLDKIRKQLADSPL